jgi:S-adenosylmethionine-dependent methyltransferase
MSQKIAQRGHDVTLCDLSSEMLKLARADIEKHGLLSQYQLVHSPVQEIEQHLTEKVDMVLFHAVMEWLGDPKTALEKCLKKSNRAELALSCSTTTMVWC